MRYLLIATAFFLLSFTISSNWQTNFPKAQQTAKAEHKYILLNFSGSDWCGPCIRMHKEIFDQVEFSALAKDKLVLVNADFPRQKKNQLPKEQQSLNDQLAEKYNKTGVFPYTILINAEGKVVKSWEGFPKEGNSQFIAELTEAVDAGR
jgi:thioredoxin-related protein